MKFLEIATNISFAFIFSDKIFVIQLSVTTNMLYQ